MRNETEKLAFLSRIIAFCKFSVTDGKDEEFYASGLVCHICGRSRDWCLDLDIYAEAQRFVVSKAKESHSFLRTLALFEKNMTIYLHSHKEVLVRNYEHYYSIVGGCLQWYRNTLLGG